MPGAFALDAYALMALFQDEPGAARVQQLIQEAQSGSATLYMTSVNLGEVVYGLQNKRGPNAAIRALAAIEATEISVVSVDTNLALDAARLKATNGMGYLDCFVAALSNRFDATIITGDPDFEKVGGGVAIEWLPV